MDTLGFTIGKKFTFTKTFAESDVYLFVYLIGDFFPAHVNEEYCKTMPYGTRLVHGCLTFSLCSTVSGMAGVASGQDILAMGYDQLRFRKPVFFGDTITATYWITEVDPVKRKTTGQCVMTNQRGGDRPHLPALHEGPRPGRGGKGMNRWHQHYPPGRLPQPGPQGPLPGPAGHRPGGPDLIEDGDCLAWSTHGSEPKVFLEHLHTIAPRLDKGGGLLEHHHPVYLPRHQRPRPGGGSSATTPSSSTSGRWGARGAGCTTISRWTSTCMPREFRPARLPTSLWPRCRQWTSTAMSI